MNLLSLAEKLAGEPRAAIGYDVERCLHRGDKFAQCSACVDACPTDAIQPGTPPQLRVEACARCLACLPACPTGAFAAEDELPDVLRCLARLDAETVELVCEKHPAPGTGVEGNSAAIRVKGCLAGLGAAAYLQLADSNVHQLVVRADACADCVWQSLAGQVEAQVAEAQQWLKIVQRPAFLQIVTPDIVGQMSLARRPLHLAGAPPVSRRDLFRGRVQEPAQVEVVSSTNPYHQRLRLLGALRKLNHGMTDGGRLAPRESAFATLVVDPSCSACGTCARACPTSALLLESSKENDAFQLTFSLQACLACEKCVHLCPEDVIVMGRDVTANEVFAAQGDEVLVEGELAQCKRCNGRVAANALEDGLCPVCIFRRKNPFGSIMPAPFAKNRPGDVR